MSVRTYPYAPYYDDTDENKNYVQVLAVSGNYSQARDLSSIGTLYRIYMERLGDSVFSNGQIISGCQLIINLPEVGDKNVVLTEGKIYLDGLVRNIRTLSTPISGTGEERIGVKIVETVVTAEQDESLRSPCSGVESYNAEGAARIKQETVLTRNDASAITLFTLLNGQMQTVSEDTGNNSALDDKLAERTFDVSGNFKVWGLDIIDRDTSTLSTTDSDYNACQVYVGAGEAYIKGYHVQYHTMKKVDLEIPTSTMIHNNEPHQFTGQSDIYKFNRTPVQSVKILRGRYRDDRYQVTHTTTPGGSDDLPDSTSTIDLVWEEDELHSITKTYYSGTDFYKSGDTINWSLLGDEPEPGATYYVKLTAYKDYKDDIEIDAAGETFSFKPGLDFYPIDMNTFNISYYYYLSRVDTLTMDSKGVVDVIKGVPAISNKCVAPTNNDPTKLTLGHVLIYANSIKKLIKNYYTVRLTQAEIYRLKERIQQLEGNVAVVDLDREARQHEAATDLRGVYTDGFVGYTKSDIWHPEWSGTIDLDQNEFTPDYNMGYETLSIKETSQYDAVGTIVSAPFDVEVILEQPLATSTILVNPYAVWKDLSYLRLDPDHDSWMSVNKITIEGEPAEPTTVRLKRWFAHQSADWAQEEKQKWLDLGIGQYDLKNNGKTTFDRTTVDVVTTEELCPLMRGRRIAVTASGLVSGGYPYKLSVNGKETILHIPPDTETYTEYGYTTTVVPAGSVMANSGAYYFIDGTTAMINHEYLRADIDGRVSGYFNLPDGEIPTGTIDVSIVGTQGKASTSYTSTGTITTEISRVRRQILTVEPYDPLAQTFVFDKNKVIVGLDLFFATRSETSDILLQIRNVVNGYPGTTIYAEQYIPYYLINANSAVLEPTRVLLNQSVYCQADVQYCFVLLTDNDEYSYWKADLGGIDVTSGEQVKVNPYLDGVMFSSSNGIAWTTHQDSDLTFRILGSRYTGDGEIVFDDVDINKASQLLTTALSEDQDNDGIDWFYAVNGSTLWNPLDVYSLIDLQKEIDTVSMKCILHASDSTCPVISKDSCNLVWFTSNLEGTYISREVVMGEAFNNVKINVQFCLPAGCKAEVYYMLPDVDPDVWHEMPLTSATSVRVNEEFIQYILTQNLADIGLHSGAYKYRTKIKLTSRNRLVVPRMRKLMSILRNE